MTSGEGGILVTDDEAIHREALIYRDQGKEGFTTNFHVRLGYNWRMSEPHAVIGLAQLRRLDEFIARRNAVAAIYDEGLKALAPVVTSVRPPRGLALQLLQAPRPPRRRRPRGAQEADARGVRRRPQRRGLRHALPQAARVRRLRRPAAAEGGRPLRPPHLPARLGEDDRRRRPLRARSRWRPPCRSWRRRR